MNKSTLVSLTSDSAVDCCHKMGVPDECIGLCKKKKPSLEPSRKQARPRSLARGDDGVILGICQEWMQSKVVKKCRELSSTKGIHLGIYLTSSMLHNGLFLYTIFLPSFEKKRNH